MTVSTRPLNFVWRRAALDLVLETYFIREVLLGALPRPIRMVPFEDNERIVIEPDTLVASFSTEAAPLLKDARQRGVKNVGLFHLADEEGKDDRSFYADADYVIRNYWWPEAFAAPSRRSLGVVWAPNGYRTGLGPIDPARHLSISERPVFGFFAGATTGRLLAGQREAMLRVIEAARLPFTVFETSGFGQGMGAVAYTAWLSGARFALVPAGNSHETIRLYDALEAGAIPIMIRSPFVAARGALAALGEPPLLLLESWEQLPEAMSPYLDPTPAAIDALEDRRLALTRWWSSFKSEQQKRISSLIEMSFGSAAQP